VSKVDLRLQCGMPCSKLEVPTVQHGTLSGAGYLHQSQDEFAKALKDRPQFGGRVTNPESQRRALDVEALGGQHLGLTIERQMPSVFGHQHGGDHRLGR
jgi:hypothetical protein